MSEELRDSSKDIKVVYLPVELIKPYWRNPRMISDVAVEAIMQSIQQYGVTQPILLDSDHVIVAGHVRWKAMQRLGFKQVPCIILNISKRKAKEYRIIDNKSYELTAWDNELLKIELREFDFDNLKIFFTDEELSELLKDDIDTNIKFYNNITDDNIRRDKEQMQSHYLKKGEAVAESYIDLICPSCTATFSVRVDEIIRSKESYVK